MSSDPPAADRPSTSESSGTAPAGGDHVDSAQVETVRLRRAPNLVAFLITGGALGAVVGLLVGVLGPGAVYYTRAAVVGFFLMMFLILGAALGAVLALVLDRISLARARETEAEVRDVRNPAARTERGGDTTGS